MRFDEDVTSEQDETEVRKIGTTFTIYQRHFDNKMKAIRVRCVASLFNLYNESSDEFVGELEPERSVKASYGLFSGQSSNSHIGKNFLFR